LQKCKYIITRRIWNIYIYIYIKEM
jgi:hypothetical protein